MARGAVIKDMKLRRASIFTKVVIAALIVYAGVSLFSLRTQVADANREKAALEAEVSELVQSNEELSYEIEHSDDPRMIEDIARNKLGLVWPGEKIFYDISK